MKKLTVVSIGGFGHSVMVFDEMRDMQDIRLVGLSPAYPDEDISFFAAHPLCNGVEIYNDYREMIKATKADVVILSTRLDIIPQVASEVAQMGCHLICEKPLALDHRTLDKLYQTIIY